MIASILTKELDTNCFNPMFQIGASPDVSMTDDDVVPDRQHLKPGPGFMRQPFKIYENLRSAVSGYRGQTSRGVYQVMMMMMMIMMMIMMMMMMMMMMIMMIIMMMICYHLPKQRLSQDRLFPW